MPYSTDPPDREAVLPDQTADDLDRGWGENFGSEDDDLERLRREVPPHHGD
jgi:hypothetical protein